MDTNTNNRTNGDVDCFSLADFNLDPYPRIHADRNGNIVADGRDANGKRHTVILAHCFTDPNGDSATAAANDRRGAAGGCIAGSG